MYTHSWNAFHSITWTNDDDGMALCFICVCTWLENSRSVGWVGEAYKCSIDVLARWKLIEGNLICQKSMTGTPKLINHVRIQLPGVA